MSHESGVLSLHSLDTWVDVSTLTSPNKFRALRLPSQSMLLVSADNVVPFLSSTIKTRVKFQKLLSDQLIRPFEMEKINALPHENSG